MTIYAACLLALGLLLAVVLWNAPPAPAGDVCNGVSLKLLLRPSTSNIVKLWSCATEYQRTNWWFVLALFEVTYLGFKSFAIPAAFSLCILSGAIFPLPIAQLATGVGEAAGSSLCYLLSRAIAKPILERLAPDKLKLLRAKLKEERDHLFTFNIFLRFSPMLPNWFINIASPVVGNPIHLFFFGSLLGTAPGLFFLALGGQTLRVAGESGFDLQEVIIKTTSTAALMAVVQLLPLWLIRYQKQRAATAKEAVKHTKKK